MELIIGGAYQGKLAYALEHFHLKSNDVYTCDTESAEIDFSFRVIDHLEQFTLSYIRRGIDARTYFLDHAALWKNSVLIAQDISCGIVPVDAELRAWREANGRLINMLSAEAQGVTRMFCGLPQVLK